MIIPTFSSLPASRHKHTFEYAGTTDNSGNEMALVQSQWRKKLDRYV
jgi:hypothetical protein